jgi:DNA polymerase-4
MTPEWLHIDINAYFATLAQQEVPALRGKPLAIIKDKGRTCVIAASKEAKQYGVKTGEPLRAARVKCPHIITWPAPFELAWSATRELQSLFNELSPDTEIFSLDEAFIPFHPLL